MLAREARYNAAMANQKEMIVLKSDLLAKVAKIEADLEVLNLARTESKLPTGDKSRLDDIKGTLKELENYTADQMRALELRNSHSPRDDSAATPEPKEKTDASDAVVRRIRGAIGDSNVAKDE